MRKKNVTKTENENKCLVFCYINYSFDVNKKSLGHLVLKSFVSIIYLYRLI